MLQGSRVGRVATAAAATAATGTTTTTAAGTTAGRGQSVRARMAFGGVPIFVWSTRLVGNKASELVMARGLGLNETYRIK